MDINDRVHKGQELAQLDQQEISAQVDAQQAQLASAEANVTTYEANIEQDKVNCRGSRPADVQGDARPECGDE